jgi:hypothetical protein
MNNGQHHGEESFLKSQQLLETFLYQLGYKLFTPRPAKGGKTSYNVGIAVGAKAGAMEYGAKQGTKKSETQTNYRTPNLTY